MTLIKICGITRLEDALLAIACGADMIGLNFFAASPRCVSVATAREITDAVPDRIECVGVFVNEPTPSKVLYKAAAAGVSTIQLHGEESPAYCRELRELRVIKALAATSGLDPATVRAYDVESILLDAATPTYGGSGMLCDLSEAARLRADIGRLFLAGGLTPDNVAAAIQTVSPDVVDVCSGVERSKGIKDAEKVNAFVAAVRAAEREKVNRV